MSDTRFILTGVALIFAGFILLSVFGASYSRAGLEADQFGDCHEYSADGNTVPVSCDVVLQNRLLFFVLVVVLIAAGIGALVKGARGRWDQDVKPEDMLGSGGERRLKGDDADDSSPGTKK